MESTKAPENWFHCRLTGQLSEGENVNLSGTLRIEECKLIFVRIFHFTIAPTDTQSESRWF